MKKEMFIEQIDEGIRTEETASTLYLQHLSAIVTRSGRPANDIKQMKDVIHFLVETNKRHMSMLTDIRERVREEATDVY